MLYRPLGSSGLKISELGFGAWGIGGVSPGATSYGRTDDQVSLAALARAFEQGINFFDTSNVYGAGHSETLLGEVFADCRERVVIATKAGFVDYQQEPDYRAASIERSLASSLSRLRSDYVDLLQLHNANADILRTLPETLTLLQNLRREGTVKLLGVSVKSPDDVLPLLDLFPFETVQANFNMLDIRAIQSRVLDVLSERGVAFLARTPMAFGFLTGIYDGEENFPAEDHRSRWSREQLRFWASGARDLYQSCVESESATPAAVALRFCLSYPAVTTTISGILKPEEVDQNVMAVTQGPLSKESCLTVERLNAQRNFFVGNPLSYSISHSKNLHL
jgi:aryl-alcohol dehydrogenase-like predicted oxidoreductase